MSEERKEYISAMVDDELDNNSESTIDNLLQSPALKGSWARYHLISDCLNKNIPESIDCGLADRISANIQNEPTVLAPRATSNKAYLKPVAGFAIAASVATMAILGIQQNNGDVEIQEQQTVSFTPQKRINSVSPQLASTNSASDAQHRLVKANSRARLNSYLVNYNEQRISSGFQGMLPYARTVTFENNKQK
jgi:sigma-E factor negative regulatory protein RseA